MSTFDTGLSTSITPADMTRAYLEAQEIIARAYADLRRAKDMLDAAFGKDAYMEVFPSQSRAGFDYGDPLKDVNSELKKRAWRQIINLLGVRKTMSMRKVDELDKNLEAGNLPDITWDNVRALSETLVDNVNEFAVDAVREVFDFLRPGASDYDKYATNAKNARFELGQKVILTRAVEPTFGGRGWHINHWVADKLRAVDNIFHLADGKVMKDGYISPLMDTVQSTDLSMGQTPYFFFQCYKNGNLHLTFKRADLVTKLNMVAGGNGKLAGK